MKVTDWIRAELRPRPAASAEALYEYMASQSLQSLPVVYVPFSADVRGHWVDRGHILDFVEATGNGDLLDFGPGDGWPSLPMAPFARNVTGLDASLRRLQVCAENAVRMGLANFRTALLSTDGRMPFPDASFDGVTAAHSLEQTPDPRAMLRELYRVLRPGGRLRMSYESLRRYAGGNEQQAWLFAPNGQTSLLQVIDRHPAAETADYYVLVFGRPLPAVAEALGITCGFHSLSQVRLEGLQALQPVVSEAFAYTLAHPGGRTWAAWLREAGFSTVCPTGCGAEPAAALFDRLSPAERPDTVDGVDALLRPAVREAVGTEAPWEIDPPLTAVK